MSFCLLAYKVGERDGGETEVYTHLSVGKFVHQWELHVYLISELLRTSTDESKNMQDDQRRIHWIFHFIWITISPPPVLRGLNSEKWEWISVVDSPHRKNVWKFWHFWCILSWDNFPWHSLVPLYVDFGEIFFRTHSHSYDCCINITELDSFSSPNMVEVVLQ